jgi:NADH-quinone oxidoreductase subunit C
MSDDEAREESHKPDGDAASKPEVRAGASAEGTAAEPEAQAGDVDGGEAPPAPAPIADEVAAAVVERFPGTVFHESHGQPVVHVERGVWREVAEFLRDEQQFTQCVDVTVVDHLIDDARALPPGVTPERFEVVANYLSHPRNRRIRAISQVPVSEPEVPSLVAVYPGVNFAEREAFDMFGVTFADHPDPTRILMPDDWVGFPLRKDDAPARVPVTFKEDPGPR